MFLFCFSIPWHHRGNDFHLCRITAWRHADISHPKQPNPNPTRLPLELKHFICVNFYEGNNEGNPAVRETEVYIRSQLHKHAVNPPTPEPTLCHIMFWVYRGFPTERARRLPRRLSRATEVAQQKGGEGDNERRGGRDFSPPISPRTEARPKPAAAAATFRNRSYDCIHSIYVCLCFLHVNPSAHVCLCFIRPWKERERHRSPQAHKLCRIISPSSSTPPIR